MGLWEFYFKGTIQSSNFLDVILLINPSEGLSGTQKSGLGMVYSCFEDQN